MRRIKARGRPFFIASRSQALGNVTRESSKARLCSAVKIIQRTFRNRARSPAGEIKANSPSRCVEGPKKIKRLLSLLHAPESRS